MSESKKHMDLVRIAFDWIQGALPETYRPFVEMDSPQTNQPNTVKGFKPDVYFDFNDQLFIGEAKTIKDFDRKHSRQQYDAYLSRCNSYGGTACLVICIPWQLLNSAKNYFRLCKIKNNYEVPIVILTDMKTECRV